MREEISPITHTGPVLSYLRAFEAAARLGSFVRAAEELHVTHGAISRQVKLLEQQLGVALFERRNRAIFLTPAGAVLAEAGGDVMARLGEAIRRLRAPAEHRPLVLSCEPTLAMRWLIPRLPGFRARHPELPAVHLLAAGGPVDFSRDRIDIALRRNDFAWADSAHAEPVGQELIGPVCSPAGGGLAEAPLLHTRTRPTAWARWSEISGHPAAGSRQQHFEHFYLSLQAAAAGLGTAIGSAYMVEDDLRAGRLRAPFGFVPDGSAYVLLSHEPFATDTRRVLFLAWLRDEMAASARAATA